MDSPQTPTSPTSRTDRSESLYSQTSTSKRRGSIPTNDLDTLNKTSGATFQGIVSLNSEINLGDEAMVVRLTLDNQYWAVGLSKGGIKFYSATNEKTTPVYSLIAEGERLPCTDLVFIPYQQYYSNDKKHRLIAVYASGHIRVWHYTGATPTSRLVKTLKEPKETLMEENSSSLFGSQRMDDAGDKGTIQSELNQIMAVSISADSHRFVTAGDDCVIRVYDLVNNYAIINRCFSTLTSDKMDGHMMRICALKYLPLQDYCHVFISGGWDDTVQLWDDRSRASLWQYYGPHISGTDALDIDPISLHIVTCSWRRDKALLQVWKLNMEAIQDYEEGVESPPKAHYTKPIVEVMQGPTNLPTMGYVARFMLDQYIIAGGSNANMLKIIDRGTLNHIGTVSNLSNGVFSIAYTAPEDKKIYKIAICTGSKLLIARMDRKERVLS